MRVLTVGRLVPDKNVGGLIEAFAHAGLSAAEAELQVVGTGPLEAELRDLASRRGVPVRFAGYLAPDAMPAAYAAADVFVLPSVFEPFGVVVREAVAAGLPLVCSRTSGAAGDVAVADRNALLVDPRDPDQLPARSPGSSATDGLRDGARPERAARSTRRTAIERSVAAFERARRVARARAPRRFARLLRRRELVGCAVLLRAWRFSRLVSTAAALVLVGGGPIRARAAATGAACLRTSRGVVGC